MNLYEALAEAAFPVFALPRAAWEGHAFVGDVLRRTDAEQGLEAIQLVYLDAIDGTTIGALVSTLGASVSEDPLRAHLSTFVARFDAEVVARGLRRRSSDPLRADRFRRSDVTVTLAGERVAATLLRSIELPLQAVRTAVRRGGATADVCVAGWRIDPLALVPDVRQVDDVFAQSFDQGGETAYPPPEWMGPEGD